MASVSFVLKDSCVVYGGQETKQQMNLLQGYQQTNGAKFGPTLNLVTNRTIIGSQNSRRSGKF